MVCICVPKSAVQIGCVVYTVWDSGHTHRHNNSRTESILLGISLYLGKPLRKAWKAALKLPERVFDLETAVCPSRLKGGTFLLFFVSHFLGWKNFAGENCRGENFCI